MRRDDSARRRFVDRQRPAVPLENGANEGQAHAVAVAAAWLGGAEALLDAPPNPARLNAWLKRI